MDSNYGLIDYYGPNEHGRDFVVGDIHGYYDILMASLDKVDFDFEKDRLFSCGDLVDRGPQNHLVLKLTQEDWFIPVAGNHEEMMFDGFFGNALNKAHWQKNTGKWARRESYKEWGLSYQELTDLVKTLYHQLPTAIELEHTNGKRYGIIHAAVPNMNWDDAVTDILHATWDRAVLYKGVPDPVENIDYVFHGHTFIGTEQPRKIANRIYLDTSVYQTGVFHIHEIGTEDQLIEELLTYDEV